MENNRREEFLEVALRRFSKSGYAATSTRQICADMKLAHSAIYNYFKSKEEILLAIEQREVATLLTGLETLLELERDAPPAHRLFRAIQFTLRRTIRSRESWQISLEAIRSLKPVHRKAAIRRRDKIQHSLQVLLDEALAADGRNSKDGHLGVLYLFGICDGLARWYNPKGPQTEDEIVDHAARWVMRGLEISDYD